MVLEWLWWEVGHGTWWFKGDVRGSSFTMVCFPLSSSIQTTISPHKDCLLPSGAVEQVWSQKTEWSFFCSQYFSSGHGRHWGQPPHWIIPGGTVHFGVCENSTPGAPGAWCPGIWLCWIEWNRAFQRTDMLVWFPAETSSIMMSLCSTQGISQLELHFSASLDTVYGKYVLSSRQTLCNPTF